MGVIEHLPQYDRVLQKFMSFLKPGGNVFLDGSACTKKYELSSFMVNTYSPATTLFLCCTTSLKAFRGTPLRVVEMHNDRHSYFLTFRQWPATSTATASS